jgi:hypothetical protein
MFGLFLPAKKLHFVLFGNDLRQASARESLAKTRGFSFSRKKREKNRIMTQRVFDSVARFGEISPFERKMTFL